ncbi:prepilin peptidase [Azohydromonas lata]|uniref:prepilin peptidase n=1 Tax=Azohydromonas lata TaxID=45677 RepID=UPI000B03B3E5|nr:A24 family peptidase [Azohydromonas lata]
MPLALLGLCIGSFLNVVAHRLPLMLERNWWQDVAEQLTDADSHARTLGHAPAPQLADSAGTLRQALDALPALTLSRPASRCPHCGTPIAWHDNLPLLGWLKRRGRCAACAAPISLRYPLVEAGTALVFTAIGARFTGEPQALLWCAVAATLLAAALIDWDTTLLPDGLTLPLLWAGLVAAALGWTLPLAQSLWGAVAGYGSLWSVYWLFKLATGKEGMGYGDFKLLAALGAWFGAWMILPMLLMASVLGAAVGIAMKLRHSLREGQYVPFGPFLAGAGLAAMLAGKGTLLGWMGWNF